MDDVNPPASSSSSGTSKLAPLRLSTESILFVPEDIWKLIALYLCDSEVTLCRFAQVCEFFYRLITHNNFLWFQCYKQRYPFLHKRLSYLPQHYSFYHFLHLKPPSSSSASTSGTTEIRIDWYQKVRHAHLLQVSWGLLYEYSIQEPTTNQGVDTLYTDEMRSPQHYNHDRRSHSISSSPHRTTSSVAQTLTAMRSFPFLSTVTSAVSNDLFTHTHRYPTTIPNLTTTPPDPTTSPQRELLIPRLPATSQSIQIPLLEDMYPSSGQIFYKKCPYTPLVDGLYLTRILRQISKHPLALHPQILIQSMIRDSHLELSNTPSRYIGIMVDFFVELASHDGDYAFSDAQGIPDPSRPVRRGQSAIIVLELTPRPFLIASHIFDYPVIRRESQTMISYLSVREQELCLYNLRDNGDMYLEYFHMKTWERKSTFHYPPTFEEKRLILASDLVTVEQYRQKSQNQRFFVTLGILDRAGSVIFLDLCNGATLETKTVGTDVVCVAEAAPYVPNTILTGHEDQSIHMWNIITGEHLVQLHSSLPDFTLYGFAFLDDPDDRNDLTATWNPPCTLTLIALLDKVDARDLTTTTLTAWHIPAPVFSKTLETLSSPQDSPSILQGFTFSLPGAILPHIPGLSSRVTSFYVLHPFIFLQTLCNHIILIELETGRIVDTIRLREKDPFLWDPDGGEPRVPFPMGLHRLYSGEMIALTSAGIFLLNPPFSRIGV